MDHAITEQYHQIGRLLLTSIGIWPYQQTHFARIQKILSFVIFLTFILVQLLVFSTRQYSTKLLLKIIAIVFPVLFVMIKYTFFIIEVDRVKHLMRQMQIDCSLLKDKWELATAHRYACLGRFTTLISLAICYFSMISFGIFQLLPLILDYVSPLNESRPRRLFVMTEYFVSQEKYFYAMVLHEALVVCVIVHALIGVAAVLIGYMLHSCALLKIASYRIENAFEKDALELPSSERQNFVYKRIINMIVIHQRAIEFANFLSSLCGRSYTLLIFVGVASTVINLVQLLEVVKSNNLGETGIMAILTSVHFLYMFVANFYGQKITDHGADLFRASYNGMWYAAPLRTQKLLLFIMQKGILSVHLHGGGIFIASMECFATLVSSAVSYFTVLYATQQ